MFVQDSADQRLVHDCRNAGGDGRPGRVVDDRAEVDGAAEVRAGSFSEAVGAVLSIRCGLTAAPR